MTGVPDKSGAEVVGGLTGFPIRSVEAGVGKGPTGIPVKSVRAGVVGGLTTVLVGAVVVVGWLTGVPDKSVGAGVVGGLTTVLVGAVVASRMADWSSRQIRRGRSSGRAD